MERVAWTGRALRVGPASERMRALRVLCFDGGSSEAEESAQGSGHGRAPGGGGRLRPGQLGLVPALRRRGAQGRLAPAVERAAAGGRGGGGTQAALPHRRRGLWADAAGGDLRRSAVDGQGGGAA